MPSITVDTQFGPVTMTAKDEESTARGATPLDAERWARYWESIAARFALSFARALVPRARRNLNLRQLRDLPAKRRRQTVEARRRAAAARRPKREASDAALRSRVQRMFDAGQSRAAIASQLHIHRRRVRRLLSK